MTEKTLEFVPVKEILEASENFRGDFSHTESFNELKKSIQEKGILSPILLRKKGKKFEVVAGSRRFKAAVELKLLSVPAFIVEMTDIEASEARIVENLQRSDIHPLEEAEEYRHLIEVSKFDLASVAVRVGKSESYVRDRLILTNLTKKGKDTFRKGKLLPSHAALIARLDVKLQKEALEYMEDHTGWNDELPAVSELKEWIHDKTLEISATNPPWKGDKEVQAAFEGCDECKGKGGDLFGKTAAEACTNPTCYAKRLLAYVEIQKQKHPEYVLLTSNYKGQGDLIGSNSYKEIYNKGMKCEFQESGIFVEGHKIGQTISLCRNAECQKHWKREAPGGHYKLTKEEKEKRKKEKQKEEERQAKKDAAFLASLEKVTMPLSEKHLEMMFDLLFGRLGYSYLQPVVKRLGLKPVKEEFSSGFVSRDFEKPLKEWAKEGGINRKLQLVMHLLIEAGGSEEDAKKL